MANNDAAGAEAAVRYFVELYNYTHVSMDLGPWLRETDDDGVCCQSATEAVRAMTENGEHQLGGRVFLDALELVGLSEDLAAYSFEATATQERYEIRAADGGLVESKEPSSIDVGFVVSFVDRQWRLIAGGSLSDS